jgi:hypothetical protein
MDSNPRHRIKPGRITRIEIKYLEGVLERDTGYLRK